MPNLAHLGRFSSLQNFAGALPELFRMSRADPPTLNPHFQAGAGLYAPTTSPLRPILRTPRYLLRVHNSETAPDAETFRGYTETFLRTLSGLLDIRPSAASVWTSGHGWALAMRAWLV